MESLDIIRSARQQSLRWRDLLWESVLEALEERNPAAATAARAATMASPVRLLYGVSTEAAALAWRYLDTEARADWIWACEFVNRTWIRTLQEILSSSLNTSAAS